MSSPNAEVPLQDRPAPSPPPRVNWLWTIGMVIGMEVGQSVGASLGSGHGDIGATTMSVVGSYLGFGLLAAPGGWLAVVLGQFYRGKRVGFWEAFSGLGKNLLVSGVLGVAAAIGAILGGSTGGWIGLIGAAIVAMYATWLINKKRSAGSSKRQGLPYIL